MSLRRTLSGPLLCRRATRQSVRTRPVTLQLPSSGATPFFRKSLATHGPSLPLPAASPAPAPRASSRQAKESVWTAAAYGCRCPTPIAVTCPGFAATTILIDSSWTRSLWLTAHCSISPRSRRHGGVALISAVTRQNLCAAMPLETTRCSVMASAVNLSLTTVAFLRAVLWSHRLRVRAVD